MSLASSVTLLAQATGADVKALTAAVAGSVPRVQSPIYYDTLPGNTYAFTAADSGKWFIWNGTSDIILVFPTALPDGFTIKVSQFASGKVFFNTGSRVFFANGSSTSLLSYGQSAQCTVATVVAGGNPVSIVSVLYDFPLPILSMSNSPAFSRNVTTMSNVVGLAFTADPSSVYDIDLLVSYTSANATNALKLGLAALPSGATCQLEARIYNTNVSGTATSTARTLASSAEAVVGAAGASSLTTATMIARVSGRIITSASGGGVIQVTAGSINTAGAISVGLGAATMTARKAA